MPDRRKNCVLVPFDFALQLHKLRNPARPRPASPLLNRRADFFDRQLENKTQILLEPVCRCQSAVPEQDLLQLDLVALTEIVRIHEQWILGGFDCLNTLFRSGLGGLPTLWSP